MSIAPWWCGIIIAAKSRSGLPVGFAAIMPAFHAFHGLHHLRCKPGCRRAGTRIAMMALCKCRADNRCGQHKC
jgi:hypothetical protein